jgi:hypothetical protein
MLLCGCSCRDAAGCMRRSAAFPRDDIIITEADSTRIVPAYLSTVIVATHESNFTLTRHGKFFAKIKSVEGCGPLLGARLGIAA